MDIQIQVKFGIIPARWTPTGLYSQAGAEVR